MLFQTVRFKPKDFQQHRPDGKDDWIWNLKGIQLVIFNLSAVIKAQEILIVEVEKDCET